MLRPSSSGYSSDGRMNIPAAVTAASKTVASIGAKARTMTPAVRKNLAGRSGNVPPNDLFPKIPQGVRMGGEPANLEYLRGGVDVSHKVPIRNAPNRAGRADNVVFESSRVNQARGAHDMSRMEVTSAHVRNALDGLHAGLRVAPKAALRSGLIAGALELPVSAAVNLIRYRRGGVPERGSLQYRERCGHHVFGRRGCGSGHCGCGTASACRSPVRQWSFVLESVAWRTAPRQSAESTQPRGSRPLK